MNRERNAYLAVIAFGLIVIGMGIARIVIHDPASNATIMVKAQAADAQCAEYGTQHGVAVAICTVPETKQSYISVYGHGPWQVFPLKDPAPLAPPQTAAKAPADAGAGSGSGSGSGQGSGSGIPKK